VIKQWRLTIALVMAFSLSPACFADDITIQQDANGVNYVTGGIGSEEVEALESFKKQFNLYFLFSEGKIGRLVDDVDISILDTKNQIVFSREHAAPRLLMSLPNGKYTAVASYQGNTQRYSFTSIAKKHQRIILNWKNASLDDEARDKSSVDDRTPEVEPVEHPPIEIKLKEKAPEEIKNDTRASLPAGV
jgi:hypothetical protein